MKRRRSSERTVPTVRVVNLKYSDLGKVARRKDIQDRTIDEHKWISIDIRLQEHLYDPGYVNIYNNNHSNNNTYSHDVLYPQYSYDLKLHKDDIHRLLQLPKRVECAMGIGPILNERELEAHRLIQIFYDYDEDEEEDKDKVKEKGMGKGNYYLTHDGELTCSVCSNEQSILIASIGQKLASKDELCNLIGEDVIWSDDHIDRSTNKTHPYLIVSSLQELVESYESIMSHENLPSSLSSSSSSSSSSKLTFVPLDEHGRRRRSYIVLNHVERLAEESSVIMDQVMMLGCDDDDGDSEQRQQQQRQQQQYQQEQKKIHRFHLKNDVKGIKMLASLTITIVYQGTFVNETYSPGYLSASLRCHHHPRMDDDVGVGVGVENGDDENKYENENEDEMEEDGTTERNKKQSMDVSGVRVVTGTRTETTRTEEEEEETQSSSLFECCGHASHSLQVVNTDKHLGRIVIEMMHPSSSSSNSNTRTNCTATGIIQNNIFDVEVTAYSKCSYSIVVSGHIMYDTEEYIIDQLTRYVRNAKKITNLRDEIDLNRVDVCICKRKYDILQSLHTQMKGERQRHMNSIDEEEFRLEDEDGLDYFEQSNCIRDLERKLSHCSTKLTVRERMMDEINDQMDDLHKMAQSHRDVIDTLVSENEALKTVLPHCFEVVTGSKDVSNKVVKLIKEYQGLPTQKSMQPIRPPEAYVYGENDGGDDDDDDQSPPLLEQSVVQESRVLVREIERVQEHTDRMVESIMLHESVPQLFPRDVLLVELNRKLESILLEQIQREEIDHPLGREALLNHNDEDDSFAYTFDSNELCQEQNEIEAEVSVEETDIERVGCFACKTAQCEWKGLEEYDELKSRRHVISCELMELRKKQVQYGKATLHVPKDEETLYYLAEGIRELTLEAERIDDQIKLHDVDKELHDVYTEEKVRFVIIRSLHDFDNCMKSVEAIKALEGEREFLLARVVAREVIDDAIEWMYCGWYFGEPITDIAKKESIIATGVSQLDRIERLDVQAQFQYDKAVFEARKKEEVHKMENRQKSTKIGVLCLLINYFQASNAIKKQKSILRGQFDVIGGQNNPPPRPERLKMMEEEENKQRRDSLIEAANAKANRGFQRKQKRMEYEQSMKAHKIHTKQKKISMETASTVKIQKHYRGYLGRIVAHQWRKQIEHIRAWHALSHASAITITRLWRGHVGRKICAQKQTEMAKYIIELRRVEAEQDEDEYWESLKFGQRRREKYYKHQKINHEVSNMT